ncbi:hypothetical protein ACS126_07825 [Sphingobacterium lactis]|uniref:hypothetical protein n=1 Tax=Sphingobacterium lactis TaxID=797291 RepID=UPI003EC621DA
MEKIKYLIVVLFLLQLFSLSAQTNMKVGEFKYEEVKFSVTRHHKYFSIDAEEQINFLIEPQTIDGYPIEMVLDLIKVQNLNDWKPFVKELADWNQVVGRGEYIIAHFRCNADGQILGVSFTTGKNTQFRNTNFGLLYKKIMNGLKFNITSPNNMHKKMNALYFSSIYEII